MLRTIACCQLLHCCLVFFPCLCSALVMTQLSSSAQIELMALKIFTKADNQYVPPPPLSLFPTPHFPPSLLSPFLRPTRPRDCLATPASKAFLLFVVIPAAHSEITQAKPVIFHYRLRLPPSPNLASFQQHPERQRHALHIPQVLIPTVWAGTTHAKLTSTRSRASALPPLSWSSLSPSFFSTSLLASYCDCLRNPLFDAFALIFPEQEVCKIWGDLAPDIAEKYKYTLLAFYPPATQCPELTTKKMGYQVREGQSCRDLQSGPGAESNTNKRVSGTKCTEVVVAWN